MSAATTLGLAAGVAQAAAYVIYARQLVAAECRPNGMTWAMWAYGALVFVAIEAHLGAPMSVLALPGVCMIASIGVAGYAFARGEYLRPDRQDRLTLALDAALMLGYVGAVVGVSLGARIGAPHALLAVAGVSALTSAWPTLRTTYRDASNERPLAWFVWSAAYGLLALAAMAEGLPWPFLVYPVLSQMVSILIGLFALEGAESASASERAGGGDERGLTGFPST